MTNTNEKILLNQFVDTDDKPAMLQISTDNNRQSVFVHALAVERKESGKYTADKILFAILSGPDAALQSVKAGIDIGSNHLSFGYGEKGISAFSYSYQLGLSADKGCYAKSGIPMPSGMYNGLGVVHSDLANGTKFVISENGMPHEAIADLLSSAFQIGLLEEWKLPIFEELKRLGHVREYEHFYVDRTTLPNLQLFTIDMEEAGVDHFISDCLKSGLIKFPIAGTGANLTDIKTPADYLMSYGSEHAKRVQEVIELGHDPKKDSYIPMFDTFKRQLFPVQAHAATAVAKLLYSGKSAAMLQGEMSSGKSAMLVASASGYMSLLGSTSNNPSTGYIAGLICPPSLTSKWPKEIKALIPNAEVIVIKRTEDFIRYHQDWFNNGRRKPKVPTYFIFSFTTLRNDAAIQPAVEYVNIKTKDEKGLLTKPYRQGFICPDCGKPHQTISSTTYKIVDDKEVAIHDTHNMTVKEWGNSRRTSGSLDANSECFHCGAQLWTKKVGRRYNNFADWANHYEKPLIQAVLNGNEERAEELRESQPKFPSSNTLPRRVAAAEYIRRKCKKFFDILLVDEIHLLKGGQTAQGHALGAMVGASKKTIGATGSLFGGKAEDVYFIWWRLFPSVMKELGFSFREVTRFNETFGNIERTYFEEKQGGSSYSNKQSRGGNRKQTRVKEIPGYSPFTYPALMLENLVNVRLVDVWPDPVELVEVPTIFVEPTPEQAAAYSSMINEFEYEIQSRDDGFKLYSQMLDYGISYLDNVSNFPPALFKNAETGAREVISTPAALAADVTYPKEAKLQEIVQTEMAENRPVIVYVRDTGSSVEERDVRPRLKAKLEEIGAKVCILDTTTTATNNRSEWLEKKIVNEGHNVCIVSQELVKVGLDLLCTPTLVYYQFSWSLFTYMQSSRRAWRIGQTEECRIYSLAYNNSYQKYMAELVAKKERASQAVNGGDGSSGLAAMLGDSGDLQSMLIQSIKDGSIKLSNTAEDWIAETSDRAREILAGIGKPKSVERRIEQVQEQIMYLESGLSSPAAASSSNESEEVILHDDIEDMDHEEAAEIVEYFQAVEETRTRILTLSDIKKKKSTKRVQKKVSKKPVIDEGQLAFAF